MSILVTGANGFLGGKICRRILEDTEHDIIAVAASQEKIREMCAREGLGGERICFLSNEAFLAGDALPGELWGALHLAFARRSRPAAEIAASLDFAAAVFHRLAQLGAERVIYPSSQGVYGNTEEIRTEETAPAPETAYTMAKYAAEVLFEDILDAAPLHTSLRLDPVTQSQNIIRGLCKSAREGRIQLKGGRQIFSFIDAEDAATAVLAMLRAPGPWERVYNVGRNRERYTLTELAGMVADAEEALRGRRPAIELTAADIALWAGMDSTRFMDKTGWAPKVELEESLKGLLKEQEEQS